MYQKSSEICCFLAFYRSEQAGDLIQIGNAAVLKQLADRPEQILSFILLCSAAHKDGRIIISMLIRCGDLLIIAVLIPVEQVYAVCIFHPAIAEPNDVRLRAIILIEVNDRAFSGCKF